MYGDIWKEMDNRLPQALYFVQNLNGKIAP